MKYDEFEMWCTHWGVVLTPMQKQIAKELYCMPAGSGASFLIRQLRDFEMSNGEK